MVERQNKMMALGAKLDQRKAQQRRLRRIKPACPVLLHPLLQPLRAGSHQIQLLPGQRGLGRDNLHGLV